MITNQIHVLIISDRLVDHARALTEYFRNIENINVIGFAENRQQVLQIAQDHPFKYLIIAGYLDKERNYEVIAELQQQQKRFLVVHWAMLDELIEYFCCRYKIPLKFERTTSDG